MHRWCCNALAKACQQMQRPLPCNTAFSTQLAQFRKTSTYMKDPRQAAVSLAATCTRGTSNTIQLSIPESQLRSQFYRLATQQPVTSKTFRCAAHLCKRHTSVTRALGPSELVMFKQSLHSCVLSFAQSALPAAARQLMTKAAAGPLSHHLRSQIRPAHKPRRPGELRMILFHVPSESPCQALYPEVMINH